MKLFLDFFFSSTKKMLIFNITGGRNGNDLLDVLHKNIPFDLALFTPNISSLTSTASGKLITAYITINVAGTCVALKKSRIINIFPLADNMYTVAQPNKTQDHSLYWNALSPANTSKTFDCIADLFLFLDNNYGNEPIEILITGSLHLVGEVIRTLQQ